MAPWSLYTSCRYIYRRQPTIPALFRATGTIILRTLPHWAIPPVPSDFTGAYRGLPALFARPALKRDDYSSTVVSYLAGRAADEGESGEVDAGVHDRLAAGDEVLLHGPGEVQSARVEGNHLELPMAFFIRGGGGGGLRVDRDMTYYGKETGVSRL